MIRLKLRSSALLDQLDPGNFDNDVDYAIAKYAADPLFGGMSLSKVINEALERYPNDKTVTLYRGLNFDTEEEYLKFKNAISDSKMTTTGLSSWSPDKNTAEAFAVTKPTYMEFMDSGKMEQIKKQREEAERITGYRGVLLKTRIPAGAGVDINKAPISHEEEIILPAGTYKVKVEDVLSWKDIVGDADPSDIVLGLEAKDIEEEHSLWRYIQKHYAPEDLSPEARSHLFKILVKYKSRIFTYIVKLEEAYKSKISAREDPRTIDVYFYGLDKNLLPWFNPEDYQKYYAKGKRELKKCIDEVRDKYEPGTQIDWDEDAKVWLDEFDLSDYYTKALRETVGEEYRKLASYDSTKEINQIKDPKERKQAMEEYQKNLLRILKSI